MNFNQSHSRGLCPNFLLLGLELSAGLVIELRVGDIAEMKNGVLMAMPKTLRDKFSPGFRVVTEDPPVPLPKGVVPLSPILELHPHDETFKGQHVMLVLPTCTGAQKAWRSVPGGDWEEVANVEFFAGTAVIYLDHFCLAFVGTDNPTPTRLKVRGFLETGEQAAKFAVVHANCANCQQELAEECCQDPETLQGFEECTPPKDAGKYRHEQEIVLSHQSQPWMERVLLEFDKMPFVTSSVLPVQNTQFEISIGKSSHLFRASGRMNC